MDINECFPSKYVSHADLRGQNVTVIMAAVVLEDIEQSDAERNGRSRKPVLSFQGMNKGLVLNKTNASRIAGLYGPETANWAGRSIALYVAETEFGGKPCKCIRVREPEAAAVGAAPVAAPPQVASAPIPAPQAVPQAVPQATPPVPVQTAAVPAGVTF